jgi:L-arabinokinase
MKQPMGPNRFETLVQRMMLRGDALDPARPIWCARAPGRIDFMGGNVDYTGGLALQIPTRESIWVAFQPSSDPFLRISNPEVARLGWKSQVELPITALSSLPRIQQFCDFAPERSWAKLVFGALHLLHQRFGVFAHAGGTVCLSADLPANRGVASSAALTVAVLMAGAGSQGIPLAGMDLVTAAQWVENVVAGAACGVMDQAAIVFGARNSLLPILCQPCAPLEPIALPAGIRLWGIDSMVRRSTLGGSYEVARAAAFMGYKIICDSQRIGLRLDATCPIPRWTDVRWDGYPSRIGLAEFHSQFDHRLPEALSAAEFLSEFGEHADPFTSLQPEVTYPVRGAMRYAVEENARCESVRSLLASGDPEVLGRVGECMLQSHTAYAACGLGAEACDRLVRLALDFGFAGAKMTGGGGGGFVVVLGEDRQQGDFAALVKAYAEVQGALPQTFLESSDGAECGVAEPSLLPELTGTVN